MKIKYGFLLFSLFLAACNIPDQKAEGKRYIITSPEIAEIICLLEGDENIAGITAECDYPAYLQNKTIVGNFGNVDFEKIISLRPTTVFVAGLEQDYLHLELKKLGIAAESVYCRSVEELLETIINLGKLLELPDRGRFVADSLRTELAKIVSHSSSPSVYVEIYADPIMSVSSSSFVGELIQLAGGINIFQDLPREYCRIDPEQVIKANPEIIILTHPGFSGNNIRDRKGWETISAIQTGRIYGDKSIDPSLILRSSPRFIAGIKQLQNAFYDTH
jgi:iron complex transport system substrate-binding protein